METAQKWDLDVALIQVMSSSMQDLRASLLVSEQEYQAFGALVEQVRESKHFRCNRTTKSSCSVT